MKKRIIRTISILLIAALSLGSLTFCGKKNEKTTAAETAQRGDVSADEHGSVGSGKMSVAEMLEKATQSAAERAADSDLGTGETKAPDNNGKTDVETERETETEQETETETHIDSETPSQNMDGNAIFEDGMTTSLGLTVPNNTRGTIISLNEVAYLNGDNVWQDGSWYWVDASETTPQRGDIVVYTSKSVGGAPTHVAICISSYGLSYDGRVKYMCIDGNYGAEPGTLQMGFEYNNSPNKGWTDSFEEAPGVEIAIGVWRSEYGELLAQGAEAAYWECREIGQMAFLQKYIPELVYGGWCYYLICIAANKVARGEI